MAKLSKRKRSPSMSAGYFLLGFTASGGKSVRCSKSSPSSRSAHVACMARVCCGPWSVIPIVIEEVKTVESTRARQKALLELASLS